MTRGYLLALAFLLTGSEAFAQGTDAYYKLGPDSLEQDGVPRGKMEGPFTLPCKVYPGTAHTYWVYVPAQYDKSRPAGLMIFNDGQAFKNEKGDVRAQNVMDNLIHRREIPVMIGVFINPGKTAEQPEPSPKDWGDRTTNRPTEYNTPDDKYARIICDELLPALYKAYNISRGPEQHAIGGASSGAIAAFMVAWERPDQFRKVISFIGSFVNLRGGHVYPERVLASDRKPIRVFLQDGRNDNRGTGRRGGKYDPNRDWFYQNVRLVAALTKKGYDVNYVWGIGGHSSKHGGAILPDMMRWLWRDQPVSVDVRDNVERSFNRPAATGKDAQQSRGGKIRAGRSDSSPRKGAMKPRSRAAYLLAPAAWLGLAAVTPAATKTETLVANTKTVVAAVVEAAQRNRNAAAPRKGDELTAYYFRAAAAAARKLPAEQAAPAYLFGLGVALDTDDMLRTNVLTRRIWRRVESDRERAARLAVLGTPTVHGRHDLCQHFVVSCALAAVGGPEAAEAAGLLKEVLDSRPGGSGFSFADLSADMAGVAFARQLLASPARLERVERSFTVADYMLPPAGLVEGLSEAEFARRYGGTDDERFLKAQEALRQRVLALPGYKSSGSKPK